MTTQLSIKPTEKGTAVVTISPKDEAGVVLSVGDLISPQWQLMRIDGTIVNERSFANSSPMSSLEIVLTGDDLAIFGVRESGRRIFSFQAQYDSDAGTGLYLTAEVEFTIQELKGQVNQ